MFICCRTTTIQRREDKKRKREEDEKAKAESKQQQDKVKAETTAAAAATGTAGGGTGDGSSTQADAKSGDTPDAKKAKTNKSGTEEAALEGVVPMAAVPEAAEVSSLAVLCCDDCFAHNDYCVVSTLSCAALIVLYCMKLHCAVLYSVCRLCMCF